MHTTPRRTAILGLVAALSAAVLAGPAVPAVAAESSCLVKIPAADKVFGKLQAAVDAAANGARIEVRGTCKGTTVIGGSKSVTIVGVPTEKKGPPILSGNKTVRVLEVKAGAKAVLTRITLRDGRTSGKNWPANSGAGILVGGRVTLLSSVVSDNRSSGSTAGSGAIEVLDGGTLVLAGTTEVRNNVGRYGGAIENYGTTIIRDQSQVHHNRATESGGAIWNGDNDEANDNDPLTIRDQARIHNNQAANGGGIALGYGTLTMLGSAKVSANTASGAGGGICKKTGTTMVGVKKGTNVKGNTPDQIAPCPS